MKMKDVYETILDSRSWILSSRWFSDSFGRPVCGLENDGVSSGVSSL